MIYNKSEYNIFKLIDEGDLELFWDFTGYTSDSCKKDGTRT